MSLLILAVSYDSESLNRRISAFENAGHVVVPASTLESCLRAMTTNRYGLMVIGATVPFEDRTRISKISKRIRPEALIISVERKDSPSLELADRVVIANDEQQLLAVIGEYRR
jgi:hypothetical protein